MAKKTKFELDDFGFDSELDMPNFDYSPQQPAKKNSREAALSLGKAAIKGAGSGLSDEMFIRRTLKSTLPRGYGTALDVADEASSTLRSLYNDSVKEVKPLINDLKRATTKIQPALDKYLPKTLSKKLDNWSKSANADQRAAMDAEAQKEASLQAQLAEVFSHQVKSQAERDRQQDARSQIREGIDQTRHKDSMGQLNAIRLSVSQLAQYQQNVGVNVQRKSLELQYRQFFVQRDMLDEMRKIAATQTTAFEKLVRNTGLPDYVKLTEAENFKQIVRNKFLDSIDHGLFGNRRDFFQKLGQGFRGAVGNRVRDFAQNFRYGIDAAEQGADALAMTQEFAGMGIDVGSPGEMVANMAGSIAAQSMGGRLGKWGAKKANKYFPNLVDKARTRGNKIAYELQNIPGRAKSWARGYGGIKYVPDAASDFLRDVINGMPGYDRSIQKDNLKDMAGPAIFNKQVSKSITEVIPGYLARIHREIKVLRTGNEREELMVYDYTKNRFTTSSQQSRNLFDAVVDRSSGKYVNQDLDALVDHVRGDRELTPAQRTALKRQLLQDNLSGESGRVEHYMDPMNYSGKAGMYASEFSDLFSQAYGQGADTNNSGKVKFSDMHNAVGQNIRVAREMIQNMVNAGMEEQLIEAGMLDDRGNIQVEKLFDMHLTPDQYAPKIGVPGLNNRVRASRKRGQGRTGGYAATPKREYTIAQSVKEVGGQAAPQSQGPSPSQVNFDPIISAIKENNQKTLLEQANETLLRIEGELKNGLVTYIGADFGGDKVALGEHRKWVDRSLRENLKLGKQKGREAWDRFKVWWKEPGFGTKHWNKRGEHMETIKGKFKEAKDYLKGKWDKINEVYIQGELKPRLTAAGLQMGLYRDKATGKIIKSWKDVKGAVIDENGELVISAEDAAKMFARSKVGTAIIDMSRWVKNKATDLWRQSKSLYGMGLESAKVMYQKGMDWMNAQDVYVKGSYETPVLQATIMRARGYISQARKDKYILSPADIDGAVENLQGDVVLTNEQIQQGLVDKYGRPLVTGKLRLIQLAKDTVGFAINKVKNGYKMAKDWLSGKWKGFADWFQIDGIAISGGKTIVERLTEIRDLLDERLPGRKKKVAGDIDGDGIREGSYEDKQRKKKEADKDGKSLGDRAKDAAEKAMGHGKSLYGFLGGLGLGGLNWWRNRKKKGADGEEGEGKGGIAGTGIDAGDAALTLASLLPFAGKALGGLGKLGKWGLGKLGKGGQAALNAVDAAASARAARGAMAAGGTVGLTGEAAEIAAAAQAAGVPASQAASLAMDAVSGGAAGLSLLTTLKQAGWKGLKGGMNAAGAAKAAAKGGLWNAAKFAGRGVGRGLMAGTQLAGRGLLAGAKWAAPAAAQSIASTGARWGVTALRGTLGLMGGVGNLAMGAGRLAMMGGSAVVSAVGLPVLAGIAAAGALAYGGYKLYKYMKRRQLTPLSKLRAAQYGFGLKDDNAEAAFKLEQVLEPLVEWRGGTPMLSKKKVKEEELLEPFGVKKDDKKQVQAWLSWFMKRFKPVFLTHLFALKKAAPDEKGLGDIEKLKPSQKKKYVTIAKYPGGPYGEMTSPMGSGDPLVSGAKEVEEYAAQLEKDIDEEIKKNPDDKGKDDKPTPKHSIDMVKNATAAGKALGIGSGKIASENFTALEKMPDGSKGTGVSAGGAIITMNGTFDAANMIEGTKLDALTVIRYKTYGLRDMNISRVKSLLILENVIQKDLKIDTAGVTWGGNPQKTLAAVSGAFGINDANSSPGYAWINWFTNRFMPTFMAYASTSLKLSKKGDLKAAALSLKSVDAIQVAEAIKSATAKGGAGSVWNITASPWPDYNVNTDVSSTTPNMDALKASSAKTKLEEEESTGKKEDNWVQKQWKKLTTNKDGSKNWLGKASDAVTNPISQAYQAAKTGLVNAAAGATAAIGGTFVGKAAKVLTASAKEMKEKLMAAMKSAGITSPTETAMFLSQMDVESGGFKALSENLNYRPDRLAAVFPKYFKTVADAQAVAAQGPEAIAERVYGGRMGNNQPGDGYRYRGRGVIQLTGRDNYARYGKILGIDLLGNPDLAADPDVAAKIAIAYWKDRGVSQPAQQGNVQAVTQKINGGQNGLAERQAKYQEYLSQVQSGALGGGEAMTNADAGAKGGLPQTALDKPGATGAAAPAGGTNGMDPTGGKGATAPGAGSAGALPQTAFDVATSQSTKSPSPEAAPATSGQSSAQAKSDAFKAPEMGPSAAMGTGFNPAATRQATDLQASRNNAAAAQASAMGGVGETLTASLGVQKEMLVALQTIAKVIGSNAGGAGQSSAPAPAPSAPKPVAKNLVSVSKPSFST